MKIGIIGSGTWGIALSRMLSNQGYDITVWSALEEEIDGFIKTHRHKNLPNMIIPDAIRFTKDIKTACADMDMLLFAVPSPYVRATAKKAAPFIADGTVIVDVAKGIEPETLFTMSEIIADELAKTGKHARIVALSGPTHAEEVALDLPTTIVAASVDTKAAEEVQDVFMNTCLRVYTNTDVKGVELCGAMKNIIALASGISQGLGYGDNTKAAIMTRGMAEITRLGLAMGAHEQTFAGLAGIGDLIVTATSVHSRNNRTGYLLGKGMKADDAIREVGMVVEGINALPAALTLGKKYGVELPIMKAVNAVVNEGADPELEVARLMSRPKSTEM